MHLLSVFSLRNRALIALLTIVIGIFGGIALTSLKQELFPSISLPNLTVISTYPGASPDVVENDVSTPIESAIQGIDGLEATSATSGAGVSTISASFAYGTDLPRAEQRIQLAINRIQDRLPAAVDTQVVTFSLSDLPVVVLAVTSDLDAEELSARLRDETIIDLANLPGVAEASLSGASGQRVTITPDTEQLFANGLSNQAIRDALDANGVLLATGVIDEGDQELTVQAGSRLRSADDIAALPLLGAAGPGVVTIGDVAAVEIVANPVTAISRVNGDPSLTISITKTAAANTVEVSHVIEEALPDLAAALGSDTEFTTVFNQAPFIEQSIEALATEGLLGLVFAVLVILLFLFSIRSTLVTAISIPASVLVTFIGMWATGYSMNVLTLGALTISIGRVVDDSIVVIENIKRHLSLGEEKRAAILTAVKEVASAVTASTATSVAVFLPIALVSDVTGELFRPFALTVTIALVASLFVSLTIVPVLAYWFLKAPKAEAMSTEADELEKPTRLQRAYLPTLDWTLRHPVITLSAAAVVLVGTVGLYTLVPTNFVGDSGQNTINVTQTLPAGSNLEAIDEASQEVEETLLDLDGVEVVQVSIGSDGGSIRSFFGGGADATYSITTDPDVDQEQLRRDVTSALDDLDGVGEVSVGSGGGGFSSDVTIDLRAADADALADAAERLLDDVDDLDITSQAESNLAVTQPYLAIEVDRATAAEYGLSEIAVGGIVANSMLPAAVGEVTIEDTVLSVYITDPNAPVTVAELRDFLIPTARGPVPLSELATVEEVEAPAQISTERGIRTATITVTPSTPNLAVVTPALEQAIRDADLPEGVSASVGGVAADQAEGFAQLYLALLAAILIVYTIMVATFRSLRQPLLLLISIPFAATGAFLLQLASGIPFGAASIIGLLMLVGIVVTNAIVLIDLVNQYRDRGMSVREALRQGGARRLRPILMTAFATIGALFFMTIGVTGQGGFISQPLGIVVTGGLVSSTILTLLVLPALYWLVEGARERRLARRAAKHGAHVAA